MEDLKAAFLGAPCPVSVPQNEPRIPKAEVSTSIVGVGSVSPPVQEEINDIDAFLSDSDSLKLLVIQDGPPVIKPRPYQKEMLEESLRRNIIVAMDTGSGKTHIAVMRMQHELERIPSHQIIWFLAPTVALCEQQYNYISTQIAQVQSKFLSGADNVDRWTEQKHWDATLKNVRIVISTYQILLDALSNGFVRMESLALLVFDEVHNCVSKHPGAKIMLSFYHPRRNSGKSVPHILGLTASPVMRSNPRSLIEIEKVMDSICRTPSKHRAELRLEVKLPVLLQISYGASIVTTTSKSLSGLKKAFIEMKVAEDPYYLSLLKDNSEKGRAKADKVRMNGKTWCSSQVKSFYNTASKINEDLGIWAADYYIAQVVEKIRKAATGSKKFGNIWDVSSAEKQYLANVLSAVELFQHSSLGFEDLGLVSDKVAKLVELLLLESATFQGIIFVQERAATSVLAHLLSKHPSTSGRFNIGTIVGTSGHSQRARNISELVDVGEQKHTISKFKSGKINLAVATTVLEEGIDVPACNAVISFHPPANLKSFVQRRGRARHRDSKLILMQSDGDKIVGWQQLEADMRQMYQDEMRTLQEELRLEDTDEIGAETMKFQVPETQALLDLDNAIQHLYHFCAKLPRTAYVDPRPEFICSQLGDLIRAKVTLPLCVDQSVRSAESKLPWKTEKNAMKDAAFQAYIALYSAKLVNDHLLPTLIHDDLLTELRTSPTDTRASLVKIREQLNPWVEVANEWKNASAEIHQAEIVSDGLNITMQLPIPIPPVPPINVQWDTTTEFSLRITVTENLKEPMKPDTSALLQSAFNSRFPIRQDAHVVEFSAPGQNLPKLMGKQVIQCSTFFSDVGLIRDNLDPFSAYTFRSFLPSKPDIKLVQNPYRGYEDAPDSPHLSLIKVPRRSNFVQRLPAPLNPSRKPYSTVVPVDRCTADNMPFKYYQFGRLIPVVMNHYERYLLASWLCDTILKDIKTSDISLIATAITASSASDDNYQRLEFLGDTVLKMCTSVQLMAQYPLWHEGYLSEMKGRIVSNSSLYTASTKAGLDRFIITKQFNGHRWRPLYVEDALKMAIDIDKEREMSSKIPADVVESLIGAALLDGGLTNALACLQTFLPRQDWQWESLESRRDTLFQRAPVVNLPPTLRPLEVLLDYSFQNKGLLIEAITHASCNSGSASLERLEFLGDAILDHLIVTKLWDYNLSHIKMHLLRTALVNADILAYLCLEFFIEEDVVDLVTDNNSSYITEVQKTARLALWQFMRHTSPHISTEQQMTSDRHADVGPQIRAALETGTCYPWALLARLQAQKFYSDIVESLIAAVWIDSGSFETCNQLIERLGIFKIMRRMLDDDVQVLNPKEELGMLADTQKVKYVVTLAPATESEEAEDSDKAKRLACKVFVGEREVVSVVDGVSVIEVETRAAEEAVRILKAEKMDGVDEEGGPGVVADGDEDDYGGEEDGDGGGMDGDVVDVEMDDG